MQPRTYHADLFTTILPAVQQCGSGEGVRMVGCGSHVPIVPSKDPVLKIRLSDLRYVMKRRYMLRHVVCGVWYVVLPFVLNRLE